jgi:hypothetical protein
MLSALILALGLGAPAQGFVIPTLKRPLLAAPRSAPLLTLRQSPPRAARRPTPEREAPDAVECAIRSIEAPPIDERMARTIESPVDSGMVLTSRCRTSVATPSAEPRR